MLQFVAFEIDHAVCGTALYMERLLRVSLERKLSGLEAYSCHGIAVVFVRRSQRELPKSIAKDLWRTANETLYP